MLTQPKQGHLRRAVHVALVEALKTQGYAEFTAHHIARKVEGSAKHMEVRRATR